MSSEAPDTSQTGGSLADRVSNPDAAAGTIKEKSLHLSLPPFLLPTGKSGSEI